MSTSILYHAFGLRGIHYEATRYISDSIVIEARLTDQSVKCPECSGRKAVFKGHKRRLLRMSPMGRNCSIKSTFLHDPGLAINTFVS